MNEPSTTKMITVLGSLNVDISVRTQSFPTPGETVFGESFCESSGGKGGNQAAVVAFLGARCRMIGRVGADRLGPVAVQHLMERGVDMSAIAKDRTASTGVATITIDRDGQNQIVVVPGANALVAGVEIERLRAVLSDTSVLLLQLEVPMSTIVAAVDDASAAGVCVVLDPAPAPTGGLPAALYRPHVILTPNEGEAAALVGHLVDDDANSLAAARELCRRGAGTAVIKRGKSGVTWSTAESEGHLGALLVESVDSVGAGDAFNAALAVELSRGESLPEALNIARATGSIAVTTPGAQMVGADLDRIHALARSNPIDQSFTHPAGGDVAASGRT